MPIDPVDPKTAGDLESYQIKSYTYIYQASYGSPEVDHTTPKVTKASPSEDGMSVKVSLETIVEGHIHDFDLASMRSDGGEKLLHHKAYYTVNEIPKN